MTDPIHLLTRRKLKDGEKFRSMSACANCVGLHESILFANAFRPPFHRAMFILLTGNYVLPIWKDGSGMCLQRKQNLLLAPKAWKQFTLEHKLSHHQVNVMDIF